MFATCWYSLILLPERGGWTIDLLGFFR